MDALMESLRSARQFALCLLLATARLAAQLADPAPPEYHVKAAFLLNFTRFIEWPAAAFPRPDTPFQICIAGDDPFGGVIDQIVEGERVSDRRLAVRRTREGAAGECHLLFVTRDKEDPAPLPRRPGMLVVGDSADILRDGGMIAFVIADRRVRFDINLRAAQSAGLRISSKLLSVARNVEK